MDIDIDCPECGRTFSASLDDFARQRTRQCPSGHRVELGETESSRGSAQRASKAMSDFEKTLRNLGG